MANLLGFQRGAGDVQGFKMSLLLKLNDIKATDRTTSLLQFCIQQAADKSETLEGMNKSLQSIKPAARLQVTAVDTLLQELFNGIKKAQAAVTEATGIPDEGAGGSQVCERSCAVLMLLQGPEHIPYLFNVIQTGSQGGGTVGKTSQDLLG
jgi:hypothetical protein